MVRGGGSALCFSTSLAPLKKRCSAIAKDMQMVRGSDILRDAKEVATIMQSSMNKEQLKDVIKTALVEVLEERQNLFQEAIETALEDIALTRAIKEGEKTKPVQRGVECGITERSSVFLTKRQNALVCPTVYV
jgi:hypothetical protein